MIKNILLPASGSPETIIAAKYAISLARLLQTKLVAVFVIDAKALSDLLKSHIFVEEEACSYEHDLEEQGALVLERIKKMAQVKQVPCETHLVNGSISDEILKKAHELPADIIVLGELKEITSRTEVFYNEGERIFRKSPCPVIISKNPEMIEQLYKEIAP